MTVGGKFYYPQQRPTQCIEEAIHGATAFKSNQVRVYVCMCIYVWIYVCISCARSCLNFRTVRMYGCLAPWVYVCMGMDVVVWVGTRVWVHVCVRVGVYGCGRMGIWVGVHGHMRGYWCRRSLEHTVLPPL